MEAIFDLVEGLEKTVRINLLEYLSSSHETACFEMLDPDDQHVEPLDHLTKPLLKFITFTKDEVEDMLDDGKPMRRQQAKEDNNNNNNKRGKRGRNKKKPRQTKQEKEEVEKEASGKGEGEGESEQRPVLSYKEVLCTNPVAAFEKAKGLGLSPVEYEIIELKKSGEGEGGKVLEDLMEGIRRMTDSEGRVLYFLDNEGAVIGTQTTTTNSYHILTFIISYFVCRPVKEKIGVVYHYSRYAREDQVLCQ